MLTAAEQATQQQTGLIPPSRLAAMAHAFRAKAADLRTMSAVAGLDERAAAALRGMACAYTVAANDAERLAAGQPLRPHKHSSATRKARAAHAARSARMPTRASDARNLDFTARDERGLLRTRRLGKYRTIGEIIMVSDALNEEPPQPARVVEVNPRSGLTYLRLIDTEDSQ